MEIAATDLAAIRELYSQGLYRQALTVANQHGPLRTWTNTPARLLAGRLAMQLGAPKLGRQLHAVAFRSSSSYPEAIYYHARYRFERFGPLAARSFMRQHLDWSDASPDLRADWFALGAFIVSRLSDIDRAEKLLAQAETLAPNRPWVWVERAAVLESAERYPEALAAAQHAHALQPWFRPAVQAAGHLLHKLDQTSAAIAFLEEASTHLQSGIVSAHLAALHLDQRDYAATARNLDRYAELSPLLEPDGAKWLNARRADVAYFVGDFPAAKEHARAVGEAFYTTFADTLPDSGTQARVMLDWQPPKPADTPTRTNRVEELLAKFWQTDLTPPTIELPPTLDGTPDFAERERLRRNGWITQEFTLNLDRAACLIDAGLPFLLTLVEVGVSQSRLVVGYDRLRQSVLFYDGHDAKPAEAPIDVLHTRYALSGPHCLVAVPADVAERVPALNDPDQAKYDQLDAMRQMILAHKFVPARAALDALVADAPAHRISKLAAVAWARATLHPVLLLEAIEDLQRDFPTDATLQLAQASAYRELGRVPERLTVLEAASAQPEAESLILQSLAQMLLPDHHKQYDANRLLRASVRLRPHAAGGYFLLGSQAWEQQRFTEAVELYRFACCIDDREDQFAESYFRVAQATNATPEALGLFQRKVKKSATPHPPAVKSLFAALLDRDETDQAFRALDGAVEKLQLDAALPPIAPPMELTPHAELLLYRAEVHAEFEQPAEATRDLELAKLYAPPAAWHRTAIRIARLQADPQAMAEHLEAALARDPLWIDGQRQYAAWLIDTKGQSAARDALAALATRFPYVYPIVRMRAEFSSSEPGDAALIFVQNVLDLCPRDAWALRQRALILADRKQDTDALKQITLARELEPDHPAGYTVLAHVHRRGDRLDDALETYRASLRNSVDHELAIVELVRCSRTRPEKLEALAFVSAELHRQAHQGEGLVVYRDQVLTLAADDHDDHAELIDDLHDELEQHLEERPDLWQAWSLMIQQLGLMHRLQEAQSLAREATERFPLLAQLWTDLARVCAALEQPDERLEALETAVRVAPAWPPAAHDYADALADAGDDADAIAVLKRAILRVPLDPGTHAALADRLWSAGQSHAALDRAKLAVRHDPAFDSAWRMVLHWSDRLERPTEALDLARSLAQARPSDARVWLRLARLLHDPSQQPEALAALEIVIRLDPRNVEAHDQKAERLAECGRFDDALVAVRPAEFAEDLPLVLQGRAAWIEARRGNYSAAIPPMQALVSLEPEYFWGWQQLAEWHNETGRSAGYLEAASQLVRLKPDHPLPLTMRGEAKLKTGDRTGGKSDLRDALRIAPQYAPAAAILFDACLAEQETREARSALAVLQEHAGGPEVLVKQIQFAARTDDSEHALRTLAELAQDDDDPSPVLLQVALAELDRADLGARAAEVLHQTWQAGGRLNPWGPLYWIDTPPAQSGPPEVRFAAIEASIHSHPSFAPAYDRKAELLGQLGRYEDALAVCHAPEVGTPTPITLLGRIAWLEAKRGDRPRAIALMLQIVANDREYLWGWRNLAQWYDAEGRHKECLSAAEEMVRLSPADPVAFGYRGEAKRTLGDRAGAKADFQRAFDLDPSFDAAGLHLVQEHLEADDTESAARTLARVQEHTEGPLVRLRAVQVAARQGHRAATLERFRNLATDTAMSVSLLREAAKALENQGWTDEVDDVLAKQFQSDACTSAAGTLWAERICERGRSWEVRQQLPEFFHRAPAAAAEAALVCAATETRAGNRDVATLLIHRHAEPLGKSLQTWAKAGAILVDAKAYTLAISWLGDWADRDDLDAKMLEPLVTALAAENRHADATTICREAILRGPNEHLPYFRAWLALACATAGNYAEATEHLATIDPIGLPDGTRLLVAMAQAILIANRNQADAFHNAKDQLRTAVHSCQPADRPPGSAHYYRAAVKAIAREIGTPRAKLWCLWQHLSPALA